MGTQRRQSTMNGNVDREGVWGEDHQSPPIRDQILSKVITHYVLEIPTHITRKTLKCVKK